MKTVINTPDGPVIGEVPEPLPAADEALIAVRAFALNRGELALLETRPDGWRPGQDIAGVVVEPAADGSGPAAGTRVAALVEHAGWSELAAIPASRLAVLPETAGIEEAAALPLAGLTALRTLRLGTDLLGRHVLITGANGGVGRFQVELAAAGGAVVTAVARPDYEKDLLDLGAADVIAEPSGGPYDLITESVGGRSLSAALGTVAPGGTVVLIGASSGEKTPINIYDFIGHENAQLISYLSYAYPQPPAPDLQVLTGLLGSARLHPTIGYTADWTELRAALTALRERRFPGKAVLTIS
jgi:NADPH2:quinone reductase